MGRAAAGTDHSVTGLGWMKTITARVDGSCLTLLSGSTWRKQHVRCYWGILLHAGTVATGGFAAALTPNRNKHSNLAEDINTENLRRKQKR
jgi:hypothetical protein